MNQKNMRRSLQRDETAAVRALWQLIGWELVQTIDLTRWQIEVAPTARWTIQFGHRSIWAMLALRIIRREQ